jgi:glycosyltransferase involved in cell wall biosynthesis
VRVLQLGPYPPPHGGVQTNLVAIRTYLRRRGVPCAVINITRHRAADGDDVHYPKTAFGVLSLLWRLRYDVIHLHVGGILPLRVLALALACTLRPGVRSVMTFHSGGYPSSPEGRTARPRTLRGFVLRRFDRLIAVNDELAALFRQFGCAPERVRCIAPHALLADDRRAGDAPDARPEPLSRFMAAHSPALVTVGLLEPEYDLVRQIEALGILRERFPNAGLAIIGSGSLAEPLREAIASAPFGEHVLLCGDVPHEGTLRAIGGCDAFLRTTLYDGDSVSVREALHLGVPVVATDNGMRPPGPRLVPVSDTTALVEAVAEVLTPTERPRAPKHRVGEDNVRAVYELYEEMLAPRAALTPARRAAPRAAAGT